MQLIRAGLAAGVLLALAAPVARADVTVRVEGAAKTLVNASVAETGPDVSKDGGTCPGNTAGGALDRAVQGDWTGTDYPFGLSVDGIRGETYTFDSGKYWGFDHDNTASQVGACGYPVETGDEVLFYAACAGATSGCFNGTPLDLVAPATATTGVPFTVTVRQFDDTKDPAVATAAAGATVGGVTTGADGTARITPGRPGRLTLTATKGDQVRDEATVLVSAPGQTTPTPTPDATAARDTTAPRSRVRGLRDGRVFEHRRNAPRTLRVAVDDASGLRSVALGLTRRRKGRCTQFSDGKGRFVAGECGVHPRFAVGADPRVSYLLPKRLERGRYTVTVRATDSSGNRERLADERNRVVFFVR